MVLGKIWLLLRIFSFSDFHHVSPHSDHLHCSGQLRSWRGRASQDFDIKAGKDKFMKKQADFCIILI